MLARVSMWHDALADVPVSIKKLHVMISDLSDEITGLALQKDDGRQKFAVKFEEIRLDI